MLTCLFQTKHKTYRFPLAASVFSSADGAKRRIHPSISTQSFLTQLLEVESYCTIPTQSAQSVAISRTQQN